MLNKTTRFCSQYPWVIIIIVFAISLFFGSEIHQNLSFEADISKSTPTDLEAIKADDYYKKNFQYQEMLLIGIESCNGSLEDARSIRTIEQIVLELKSLKGKKSFHSRLTGKEEHLVQSIGIDSDQINSMATLEDVVMDSQTGAVVTGSYIKKLKTDYQIDSSYGEETLLPRHKNDLEQILPRLTERILRDRTFRNFLLSEERRAATISVPVFKRWKYKKRYAIRELMVAMDEGRLTDRFQGKTSAFPFKIFNRPFGDIKVDDQFIRSHSAVVRSELRQWLADRLLDVKQTDPGVVRMLDDPITAESFQKIMMATESKGFFDSKSMITWTNFVDDLWQFTLTHIDPFSRENLEFQLYNVEEILCFQEIYQQVNEIIERYPVPGVQYYVAGFPVVVGVISSMIQADLKRLIPIAVLIILFVLAVSFRTVRGVFIPAITVMISVIWTIGLMSLLRVPITMATTCLPVILLGIGTAYAIHILNRYNEDASQFSDRRSLVVHSVSLVGSAVIMAALTTIAGFGSLVSSRLAFIREFGVFSAVGVLFALILSMTLTPSLLSLCRIPVHRDKNGYDDHLRPTRQIGFGLGSGAQWVASHPKPTLVVLLTVFGAAGILSFGNRFEGSIMRYFKSDNPLYQSDQFLNRHLTGTTNINLMFKFREQLLTENPEIKAGLVNRLHELKMAWKTMVVAYPEIKSIASLVNFETNNNGDVNLVSEKTKDRLTLIADVLDDEYSVQSDNDSEDLSSVYLDLLLDDDFVTESAEFNETIAEDSNSQREPWMAELSDDTIQGLQNIHERAEWHRKPWQNTGRSVLALRNLLTSEEGLKLKQAFNRVEDILVVDIRQPSVLRRLEILRQRLEAMEQPVVVIEDQEFKPTGAVVSPTDPIRKFYRVFYHNDNIQFDRLPDVQKDGFPDITLTDRMLNAVVLNQVRNGDRELFEKYISPDLKEFQIQVMIRDGTNHTVSNYLANLDQEIARLFPKNDPYIESVRIGGNVSTNQAINELLSSSQIQSICISFLFVFLVTFFIFRSAMGGLFSLIPLAFTVVANFGLLNLIVGEINLATMLVASIAIGTGVDYTIHFLQRYKIQLQAGDSLTEAYIHTVGSVGRAIILNAVAVALGFLVLVFSDFIPQMVMGILMAATMFFSSVGALVLLPCVIILFKPHFLTSVSTKTDPVVELSCVSN